MTKEELEKEAEEVSRKHWIGYPLKQEIFKQGYFACAEPREKQIQIDAEQIRALQKQNGELTDELKALRESIKDYGAGCYENGLRNGKRKLEQQIEKMKCCGNCENGELSAHEEPCLHCQRCFASTDVTDQENVKDYWEAIKEIKEND